MIQNDELNNKIKSIIAQEFECDITLLNEDSRMNEISGWDSINHLSLILKIEEEFNVTMSPEMMIEMTSISGILSVLNELGVN